MVSERPFLRHALLMTTTRAMAARQNEEEEISPIEEGETVARTSTSKTARPNLNTKDPSIQAMIGSLSEQMVINNQMMMEMMGEI